MNSRKHNFFLIIFGPTSVGKSDVALTIANNMPAEIVNMDVGQLYTPLSIGTAKPDWRSSPIPHHLFDVINEQRNFTATEYRRMLLEILEGIWQRGKLPIVVGGSAFYLRSIFFPPPAYTKGIDIQALYSDTEDLWQKLHEIDPTRAQQIDKQDMYRIKRALAIWHETGKLPSSFEAIYQPPADFVLLMLTRERKELYDRINIRVHQMINKGWLDEVEKLCGTDWEKFIQQKKLIGYNELIDYHTKVGENKDLNQVVNTIQKRTRNYAKRQHTFWNMLEQELKTATFSKKHAVGCIESVNLTFSDLHLYIKELLQRLSIFYD